MMKTAYLALGSNIGNRINNIKQAVATIGRSENCCVTKKSSIYLTKPVGVQDQPDFINAVIEIESSLEPRELLKLCKDTEQKLGRTRTFRWGPRVIDIDVLLYNDVRIEEDDLVVPHPGMMERAFVLVPLAEIAPELVLPNGVTASEAARRIGRDGVKIMEETDWED